MNPEYGLYNLWPAQLATIVRELGAYWVKLRAVDPSVSRSVISTRRFPKYHDSGHPAGEASDDAAKIVEVLTSLQDRILLHRSDPRPSSAEAVRVTVAVEYLCGLMEDVGEGQAIIDSLDIDVRAALVDLRIKLARKFNEIDPEHESGRFPCPVCPPSPYESEPPGMVFDRDTGKVFKCIQCGREMPYSDYQALAAALDELLPIEDAVAKYKVPRSTIDSWIDREKIGRWGKDENGHIRVSAAEVERENKKRMQDPRTKRKRR